MTEPSPNRVANLEESLQAEMSAKYDSGLDAELRLWLKDRLDDEGVMDLSSCMEVLKDGTRLCRLANTIVPNSIPSINRPGTAFKEVDNLSNYLRFCSETLGFGEEQLFSTVDLYEGKAMGVVCVSSLSDFSCSGSKPLAFYSSICRKWQETSCTRLQSTCFARSFSCQTRGTNS